MENILAQFEDNTATVEFVLVTSSGTTNRLVTKPQSCYQTELKGCRVVFKVFEDVFHHFIVSFGTPTEHKETETENKSDRATKYKQLR